MDKRSFLQEGQKRILGGITYEIESVVGSGASTIVYEAAYQDTLNEGYFHKVLMKELYPYQEDDSIWRDEKGNLCWDASLDGKMEDYKYFFRKGNEMNIRLLKNYPQAISGNVNSYKAYGTYYSILPLHGGKTLEAYLADQEEHTLKESLQILMQILDALSPFHENGMLNLDVSPDNILLLDDRAMFIDYNSAWDLNDTESNCFFSQKEGYSAPEILLQEYDEIGYCSDIYSVTAVFYHMITGKRFDFRNKGWEKMDTSLSSSLPKEVSLILKKGLHPLCDKRYKSIDEYRNQVSQLITELEKKENTDKSINRKAFIGGMALIVLLIAAFLAGKRIWEEKPWLTKVVTQGNTNANLYNKARICKADEQYEYYIDKDGNLLMSEYDPEKESFDLPNAIPAFSQKESQEGDGVDFLNLGSDSSGKANKLYFCYYGGEGQPDSIMSMNLDGTDQETLFTHEANEIGDYYSYAHLSDGKEYIYYMVGPESEETEGIADDYTLWRYDIKDKSKEELIDTSVQWFNIYDRYIYYIEYDYDAESYHLMRATLEGKSRKLLDEKNEFIGGFVQDDHMYLERYLDNEYSIQSCDLKGKILYEGKGIYALDLSDIEIGYAEGWIFYSKEGDQELRKIRLDGTADKLIYKGMDCYSINCIDNYLYLAVDQGNEDYFLANEDVMDDYLIERNGKSVTKVR